MFNGGNKNQLREWKLDKPKQTKIYISYNELFWSNSKSATNKQKMAIGRLEMQAHTNVNTKTLKKELAS